MAMVNYVTTCIAFSFFLANVEVSNSFISKSFPCEQTGNCRCVQRSGDGIDLSPLINHTTNGLKFLTAATSGVVYFFHPCSNWPLPSRNETECSHACGLCFFAANEKSKSGTLDVHSVLSGSVNGSFHLLGYASNGVFQSTESELHIVFKHINYSTTIQLDCGSSGAPSKLDILDPNASADANNHTLILRSPYSCPRHLTPHTHHMSGMMVFFLILLTIAAAYFFGGMLVLRTIKGATGTEMIPNYDFWMSLCSRIKNGFMRLFGSGAQGADTYERI